MRITMIERSSVWGLARPRGDRVWGYPIYEEEREEVSAGGIILANVSSRKVLRTLEVIRVGPNVTDINEGDVCTLDSEGAGEVVVLIDEEGEAHNIYVVHEKYIALVL